MRVYFITFRSVTTAQRAESVLRQGGIHCTLQRTPRWMEEQGCGYCLRIRGVDLPATLALLRQRKIGFRKTYIQHPGGEVEALES